MPKRVDAGALKVCIVVNCGNSPLRSFWVCQSFYTRLITEHNIVRIYIYTFTVSIFPIVIYSILVFLNIHLLYDQYGMNCE